MVRNPTVNAFFRYLALAGVVLAAFGLYSSSEKSWAEKRYVKTEYTIIDVEKKVKSKENINENPSYNYYYTYEYSVNGAVLAHKSAAAHSKPADVGTAGVLFYSPSNPENVIIEDGDFSSYLVILGLAAMAAGIGLNTLYNLKTVVPEVKRRKKRPRQRIFWHQ